MNYKKIKTALYKINRSMRLDNGLYVASLGKHYINFCWWRDIFYQSLPNLKNAPELFTQTYHSFLDYLIKYEHKMEHLTKNPYDYNNYTSLHPRIFPCLSEITPNWGNMQADAVFLMLFGIGLAFDKKVVLFRTDKDKEVVQKCINMYETIEYWKVAGNDVWEESCDVHSHQIGAGLAALIKLKEQGFIVDDEKLLLARTALNNLLPKETIYRDYDLAQLQLIFPLNIVSEEQAEVILKNVETNLIRKNGVIRYKYDQYYNIASENSFRQYNSLYYPEMNGKYEGNEMEWSFGFAYLSIIHKNLGDYDLSKTYLDKILNSAGDDLLIPEGYYANTNIKNDNTPLGWSTALTILAIDELYNI